MTERDLIIAALERANPAERDAYLAEACGGDVDLLQRLKRLLRLHQEAGIDDEQAPPAAAQERALGEARCRDRTRIDDRDGHAVLARGRAVGARPRKGRALGCRVGRASDRSHSSADGRQR